MDIALFSPSSLFADDPAGANSSDEESKDSHEEYVERNHQFPGLELLIREFSFHELNANLLWPGIWLASSSSRISNSTPLSLNQIACTQVSLFSPAITSSFKDVSFLLDDHASFLLVKRICGTGALAIFLKKSLQLDITTSDYDDQEIEENIAHNCRINGLLHALPHIKYTWGDDFPIPSPHWDLILASEILLYVKQYPNLIRTLSFLLKSYKREQPLQISPPENEQTNGIPYPAFLMSWRRRIGKEDESLFFKGCEDNGHEVQHLGSCVYCIHMKKD